MDLEVADVDLALRYGPSANMPAQAQRLFGEQLTPVASPWLLKTGAPLRKPADLAQYALIEAGDAHRTHLEWLTWRRWFDEHQASKLQPKRWLYFNYAYQMVQAALAGQGVVLARMPMVAESLANGDLVEPMPQLRLDSPMAYWLIVGPRSAQRPEIQAFCAWLTSQAQATRRTVGEVPDPDTIDHLD
jgi:LysR family transcriptional regulator, glycine cleavage system transcriptional activator